MDRRSESDLQEALVSGDTTRVLNVEDGGRGRTIEGDHMQLHGPLKSIVQPIALQCGLLGCRVGASNPGPVQTCSAKLRTTQLDSDPEQVVPDHRCALLSRGSSEDDGPTVRMPRRDVPVDRVHGPGGVRGHSSQEVAPLPGFHNHCAFSESVVDAWERDLSLFSHEAEDIGDVRYCTGVAVVQRAVNAQHQCARVANLRRPRQGVLVDSWCLWRPQTQTALLVLGQMTIRSCGPKP